MKRLLIDLETAPILAHTWGIWQQNVGINQIIKPGYILCYAAKWYGKRQVLFDSVWDAEENGTSFLGPLWDLLNEADAVIHYNGKRFDIPKINSEFWLDDLTPPSPFKQIDLLKVVKKNFGFPSNKLAYILDVKGLEGKLANEGHGMWRKVIDGDPKARAAMKRYNKRDVTGMEPLYDSLIPWISDHPNMNLYGSPDGCPNCGNSEHLRKEGIAKLIEGSYQRWKCQGCGAWSRGKKRIDTTALTQVKL